MSNLLPHASRRLSDFAAENGWLLLWQKVVGAALRRLRDGVIERKLGTTGFRVGRTPRLLGLRHCHVGVNFSAGNDLWLEAVTFFAGESLNPSLTIGDDCNLSDQVHIGCTNEIRIGSGFLCGSRVLIIDHGHGFYGTGLVESDPAVRPNLRPLSTQGKISIGQNVWVGDGVVILAGALIGDGAVVGANSVVSGVVAAETMVVGAPARVVRRWDRGREQWVKVVRAEP